MTSTFELFFRTVMARAYPRIVGLRRQPSWVFHEAILPILSVSAFVFSYRAMNAPPEYKGYVILGGAMTTFWMNVLWSMGAQLYWERSSGNLELYIMSPAPMMGLLAGMALGGMILTMVRAAVIFGVGTLFFQVPFDPTSWWLLIAAFGVTLLALYGLGMMFASVFLLYGREAWHIVNLLQEPVYVLSGMNFPIRIFSRGLAIGASIIPLTLGMDALRQLLFRDEGVFPLEYEMAALGVLAVLFIYGARRMLGFIERKAREEGKLTVKWS